MKDNLINNLNQIRTILDLNDDLHVSTTKEFYEIFIELNRTFQLKCLIHQSTDLLIIRNIEDLNIHQLSNSKSWLDVRNYFHRLIQQSDSHTSLCLIIRLMKEYISTCSRQNSQQYQIVTWNILSNESLDSFECYKSIFKQFERSLPDVICLQNVTQMFFDLLSEQIWFGEHRYIRIPAENCPTNGQLILLKNIRPELVEIDENQYVLVRFHLKNKTTIDLIHVHLKYFDGKLFEKFQNNNNNNILLVGDFGLIDDDDDDYQENFRFIDLWKEFHDIDYVGSLFLFD